MGTRCPGTLRFAFPLRRDGSRFMPPRASLGVHTCLHTGCSLPMQRSARTEHASSPAGFSAERLTKSCLQPSRTVHRRARRSPAPKRVEPGGSPRWSRPAKRPRMNGFASSEARSIFASAALTPLRWGATRRSNAARSKDRATQVSERRRKHQQCSFLNRPWVLLRPRSWPLSQCPLPSEEAPTREIRACCESPCLRCHVSATPPPTTPRHPRRRPAIIQNWAPWTPTRQPRLHEPKGPIHQVPSTTDPRSAGAAR